jgi:uncharacterized BrkB/YihY/UPF0761 family membrane protein
VLRRFASSVLAIGIAAISGFVALLGLVWGFALKCDDSCGTPPPWRDDPNAWQWNALGWVGIAGFVCAFLFFVAVVLRRRLVAWAALIVWTAVAVAFLEFFGEAGLTSQHERGRLGLAAALLAGVTAIALTPTRKRRHPS